MEYWQITENYEAYLRRLENEEDDEEQIVKENFIHKGGAGGNDESTTTGDLDFDETPFMADEDLG